LTHSHDELILYNTQVDKEYTFFEVRSSGVLENALKKYAAAQLAYSTKANFYYVHSLILSLLNFGFSVRPLGIVSFTLWMLLLISIAPIPALVLYIAETNSCK
jgi:hypothetical protein